MLTKTNRLGVRTIALLAVARADPNPKFSKMATLLFALTNFHSATGFFGTSHFPFRFHNRLSAATHTGHVPGVKMTSAQAAELPVTWSNRLGLHLTPIATGLWAAERPFVWNSIDVGGRSVIARMPDGTLLVHSPIEWTPELGERIDRLGGGVGHIISPNYEVGKFYFREMDGTYSP